MATVETHAVGRRYGPLVAVSDLTFTLEAGDILGVLGPNGAGKTTAIRVLTTILAPSWGSFEVAGVPHTRPDEIRRRIGVLPESTGYPETQTGVEYLVYHARLHGQSRRGARTVSRQLLDEVGLGERGERRISTMSRGMRQRLGIARTLVNDPDVVFLDEPTLGLDPAGQHQILQLVRRIASGRGVTVLLSTHLLAEVEANCPRVLILHRGRVVADGTVGDVVRRAAAPRSGRLRVAPEDAERARAALASAPDVGSVAAAEGQPGWLTIELRAEAGTAANSAVRALLDAGIPLLAFELEGGRLSDAFLAMTVEVA